MADLILASIVLLVWIILARTVLRRGTARRRRLAPAPHVHSKTSPAQHNTAQTRTEQNTKPFSCRVTVEQILSKEGTHEVFSVDVIGRITVPTPMHETEIQILLADITGGDKNALPVLCNIKKWQLQDSPAFCYRENNVTIPRTEFVLSDWVHVTNIPTETLNFPRKGPLRLKFVTSLISHQTQTEIACATTHLDYANTTLGYIDVRENARRTETLTIQLALSVSAGTEQTDHNVTRVIEQWIEQRAGIKPQPQKDRYLAELHETLDHTVQLLAEGDMAEIENICAELLEIATIVEIYDVMDLCLRVIGAGGVANPEQTELITRIADLLQVDETRFRAMTQKRLPITMHRQYDLEFILGITADMPHDRRRQRLNDEYKKWNARVNHPDREIQEQADQMLNLIAEARDKFVHPATT